MMMAQKLMPSTDLRCNRQTWCGTDKTMKHAVVKVDVSAPSSKNTAGTAFFAVLHLPSEDVTPAKVHLLVTNEHIISFNGAKCALDETLTLNATNITYAYSSAFLDVTVLQLAPHLVHDYRRKGVQFLDWSAGLALSTIDSVVIYQHPDGGPLCHEFGTVVSVSSPFVCYTVDTEHGSSGSPILDSHGQLVAVHHSAGKGEFNCGMMLSTVMEEVLIDRSVALTDCIYPLNQSTLNETCKDTLDKIGAAYELSEHTVGTTVMDMLKCKTSGTTIKLVQQRHRCYFTLADVTQQIPAPWRTFQPSLFDAYCQLAAALPGLVQRLPPDKLSAALHKHTSAAGSVRQSRNNSLTPDTTIQLLEQIHYCLMVDYGISNFCRALIMIFDDLRKIDVHCCAEESFSVLNEHIRVGSANEIDLLTSCAAFIGTTRPCTHPGGANQKRLPSAWGVIPSSPKNYVARNDITSRLQDIVSRDLGRTVDIVVLWGMGGLGKTTVVADLVESAPIKTRFRRIIWHKMKVGTADRSGVAEGSGSELRQNLQRLADLIGALTGSNTNSCSTNLQSFIHNHLHTADDFKDTLLVVDNIWTMDTAKHFLFDFPTLFTSRRELHFDSTVKTENVKMTLGFSLIETEKLFQNTMSYSKDQTEDKKNEITFLHFETNGYPLVLTIIARIVAKRESQKRDGWSAVNSQILQSGGVGALGVPRGEPFDYEYKSPLDLMEVVMQHLDDYERDCLAALALVNRGAQISVVSLNVLWSYCLTKEYTEDVSDTIDDFLGMALIQKPLSEYETKGYIDSVTVHDIIHEFVSRKWPATIDRHKNFVEKYENKIGKFEEVIGKDVYMAQHLSDHLIKAELYNRWAELFLGETGRKILHTVFEMNVDLDECFSVDSSLIDGFQDKLSSTLMQVCLGYRRRWFKIVRNVAEYRIQLRILEVLTNVACRLALADARIADVCNGEYVRRSSAAPSDVMSQGRRLLASVKKGEAAFVGTMTSLTSAKAFFVQDVAGNHSLLLAISENREELACFILDQVKRSNLWEQFDANEASEEGYKKFKSACCIDQLHLRVADGQFVEDIRLFGKNAGQELRDWFNSGLVQAYLIGITLQRDRFKLDKREFEDYKQSDSIDLNDFVLAMMYGVNELETHAASCFFDKSSKSAVVVDPWFRFINFPGEHSSTPLLMATQMRLTRVVERLLADDAALRHRLTDRGSCFGDTALHVACNTENAPDNVTRIIALLLRAGADPLRANRFGWTSLDCAVGRLNGTVIDALATALVVQDGEVNCRESRKTYCYNDVELLALMLDITANECIQLISALGSDGHFDSSPLRRFFSTSPLAMRPALEPAVASLVRLFMRQLYVDKGRTHVCALVNKRTTNGEPVLALACRTGRRTIVFDLIKYGANGEILPGDTTAALFEATRSDNEVLVGSLLDNFDPVPDKLKAQLTFKPFDFCDTDTRIVDAIQEKANELGVELK